MVTTARPRARPPKRGRALPTALAATRRGLALPLALAAVVLVGILAASGLYLAAQERRAAENGALAERALAAAELGVGLIMERWDSEAAASRPLGDDSQLEAPVAGAFAEVALARIAPRTFWAVAEGRASRGGSWARRRVNAVLRVAVPAVLVNAAVTSSGPVTVGDAATISGGSTAHCVDRDEVPAGVAGLLVPSIADATGDLSNVTGVPPLLAEGGTAPPFAADGPARAWITSRASVVLPDGSIPRVSRPSAIGDRCDTADPTNWGEPRPAGVSACQAYRRVVHARGDLRLEGEHLGQGILLVDGDLSIPGRLVYRGLLIIGGRLDVAGEIDVQGAVLLGGGNAGASWLGPGSVVQYGRCEIDRALTSAGRPVIARERGWADLF